jgi:hypothetical protein
MTFSQARIERQKVAYEAVNAALTDRVGKNAPTHQDNPGRVR